MAAEAPAQEFGQSFSFGEVDEPAFGFGAEAPSEETLASMFVALSKCTSNALACRQKELYARALQQLQRGLHACEVVGELAHPRVALAIAKTRLNIGAILSQNGRHEEAMLEIQQSEDVLANLLAWCDSCDPSDIGVCAIFEEAVALRCMALIASAVEEEHFGPLLATPPQTPRDDLLQPSVDPCRFLYEEAAALAAAVLPPTHPVIPYTRIKRDEYVSKVSAEEEVVDRVAPDGESHAEMSGIEASRGVLPIQVQADPRRWNLSPAARRMELDGGYMLRWRPVQESPDSSTKATGAKSPSKGDLDRRHPGPLDRKGNAKLEQSRSAPEELLPRLDGEDHGRERTRHRRNPFVEWTEGDTSKTEERKRRMEDSYQDMFQKRLHQHRTSYILDFKRMSNDDLYENRTKYTNSSHLLRTKELSKKNLTRSMPVLKTDQSARTRKKKKEDENELNSLEAASAHTLREQIKQSHRSLQDNTPKIPWSEFKEETFSLSHDSPKKPVRASLGHATAGMVIGMGTKKQELTQKKKKAQLSDYMASPKK